MFSNLNMYNVVILVLLALFIFGDKLPQVIADVLRMVRNLRRTAQNATSDLSRELGTEVRLEDLHPKAFVRKHLLSEADQDALTRPFKGLSDDLLQQGRHLQSEIKDVGAQAQEVADEVTDRPPVRRAGARGDGRGPGAIPAGAAGASPTEPASPAAGSAGSEPPARRSRFDDIT